MLLPAATSTRAIADVRENPRLAVTVSHVPTHRTFQLKGDVTAVRDGTPEDRALSEHYRQLFADELAFVGQPAATTLRLSNWPCFAIEVAIRVCFVQTPGPTAGVRLSETAGII